MAKPLPLTPAPEPADPDGLEGPPLAAWVCAAAATWLLLGSGVRLYLVLACGPAPAQASPWLGRVALLHGFASDVALLALGTAPVLGLAYLLRRRPRARLAPLVATIGLLGAHGLLLALNVVAFLYTGSRINLRLAAYVSDPVAAWDFLQRSAGGTAPFLGLLTLAVVGPTAVLLLLRRVTPAPRRRSAAVLAIVAAGLATGYWVHTQSRRRPNETRAYTTSTVLTGGDARFRVMVREYGHPLLESLADGLSSGLDVPTHLSTAERRQLRAALLPDDAPPLAAEFPVFRRWSPGEAPLQVALRRAPRERLNLVLLILESNGAREMGAYGHPGGHTPAFDDLAAEGLLFERFYANGTNSGAGLFTIATSAYANFGPQWTSLGPAVGRGNLFDTLAESGYATAFTAAFDLDWEGMGEMVRAADTVLSDSLPAQRVGWGDDRRLFGQAAEWLATAPEPFFLTLFTATHHQPWTVPGQSDAPQGEYARSLAALRYQDDALGEFFARARRAPWFERTLFVLVGDHGSRLREDGRPTHLGTVAEEAVHVPLLLYCPGRLPPGRSPVLGSHVDLAPTLLDAVGIHGADAPFCGASLLRGGQERVLLTVPYGHGLIGLLRGDLKVVLNTYYWQVLAYPLGSDRALEPPLPPEATRMIEEARTMNRFASYLVESRRLAPR